jgi:replicative DNA helicase
MDNKTIEEAILGAVMIDLEAQIEFSNTIQSVVVFEAKEHQIIAQVLLDFIKESKKIDIITVANELKKIGEYANVGGAKKLSSLSTKFSTVAHVDTHIRILLENFLKRSVGQFAQKMLNASLMETEDIFETISKIHDGLDRLLNQVITEDEKTIGQVVEVVSQKWEIHNKSGLAGLSTGINIVDQKTAGLVNSDLIIIAARPGQGKTAFVLSIMRNLAIQGIPTGIFSLEMSNEQLVDRLIIQDSDVFGFKVKRNTLDNFDRERLYQSASRVRNWPLLINDQAGISIRKLKSKALMWKKKYGIKLLVVDYLQLMGGDNKKGQNREGEISEISRALKVLAKDLNIPVIALSQLSRAVEARPNKIPQLSDLRESGAIEQDANIVMFLMRPEYYKMTEPVEFKGINYAVDGLCIVEIAKNRDGDVGAFPVKFSGPIMKFLDYETTSATFEQPLTF